MKWQQMGEERWERLVGTACYSRRGRDIGASVYACVGVISAGEQANISGVAVVINISPMLYGLYGRQVT